MSGRSAGLSVAVGRGDGHDAAEKEEPMSHSWVQRSRALARAFWTDAGGDSNGMRSSTDTMVMVEMVRRSEERHNMGC